MGAPAIAENPVRSDQKKHIAMPSSLEIRCDINAEPEPNIGEHQDKVAEPKGLDVAEEPEWVRRLLTHEEPTMEDVVHGNSCILVTAPHSIFLQRDGEQLHMVEEFTAEIMHILAKSL